MGELQREHLYAILGWRCGDGELDDPPTDYQIHFAPTEITAKGSFENTTVTVTAGLVSSLWHYPVGAHRFWTQPRCPASLP